MPKLPSPDVVAGLVDGASNMLSVSDSVDREVLLDIEGAVGVAPGATNCSLLCSKLGSNVFRCLHHRNSR
jgi:hypothetical protein